MDRLRRVLCHAPEVSGRLSGPARVSLIASGGGRVVAGTTGSQPISCAIYRLHLPARPPLVLASLREPLGLGVDSIEEAISGAVLEGPTCGSSRRASGAVDQLTGGLSSGAQLRDK